MGFPGDLAGHSFLDKAGGRCYLEEIRSPHAGAPLGGGAGDFSGEVERGAAGEYGLASLLAVCREGLPERAPVAQGTEQLPSKQ